MSELDQLADEQQHAMATQYLAKRHGIDPEDVDRACREMYRRERKLYEDGYPFGTAMADRDGDVWQMEHTGKWSLAGDGGDWLDFSEVVERHGPLTTIWVPEETDADRG